MKAMRSIVLPTAVALVAALSSCKSGGPRQARTVGSPEGPVVIHPLLEKRVGLPETHEPRMTHTPDGKLHFQFHLQNQTDRQILVRVHPVFYDEAGTLVDDRGPRTEFLQPYAIEAIPVTSSSRKAKKVKVQVAPAN